jgi:hypothetical protein
VVSLNNTRRLSAADAERGDGLPPAVQDHAGGMIDPALPSPCPLPQGERGFLPQNLPRLGLQPVHGRRPGAVAVADPRDAQFRERLVIGDACAHQDVDGER